MAFVATLTGISADERRVLEAVAAHEGATPPTRRLLIADTGLRPGVMRVVLDDLEVCGFIRRWRPNEGRMTPWRIRLVFT